MEVTTLNFKENFEVIKESIHSADFIAVDTEFTGYSAWKQDRGHLYDYVENRYQKLKYACQRFKAIQIGICTFHYSTETNSYTARPFNFYVINYSKLFSGVFSVRADCLYFLAGHGFDFGKLYREGITYQRLSEKQKIMASIREQACADWAVYQKRDKSMISKANQEWESLKHKLPSTKNSGSIAESPDNEETKSEFSTALESVEESDPAVLWFNHEMGFSLVIEEMIKAKKPLIGHNSIYDIGFIYDQFIAPLPDTYLEFTKWWRECFPVNYDTKVISLFSKVKIFRKTDLESLYKTCRKDQTVREEVNYSIDANPLFEKYHNQEDFFNNESKSNWLHEAGFDAFMTGAVFMCLTKHKELLKELEALNANNKKNKNKANRKPKQKKNKNKGNPNQQETAKVAENLSTEVPKQEPDLIKIEEEVKHKTDGTQVDLAELTSPAAIPASKVEENKEDLSKAAEGSTAAKAQSESSQINVNFNSQECNLILLNIKGRCYDFKATFDGEEPGLDFSNVIWIRWGDPVTSKSIFDWENNAEYDAETKTLTTNDLWEVLSTYGDVTVVKDSDVSCYASFKNVDFTQFDWEFDKAKVLQTPAVLKQIQKDVKQLLEERFEREISKVESEDYQFVLHHSTAERFNAKNNYW